eukprot:gnl/TRDRNA2_/TRDRNA2_197313_c0_seq1.p2 gnl/TRDRNA2_/TRDRNA2_197313_c0~~gnl/TRDRNA2_/TRDRNA2_197313_c0_seq1.p2  ORF type:complete len:317 (+),score=78.89 gnl/TRDRNA2_/TRDRNA2_197313_c0_seq1:17-967(+)
MGTCPACCSEKGNEEHVFPAANDDAVGVPDKLREKGELPEPPSSVRLKQKKQAKEREKLEKREALHKADADALDDTCETGAQADDESTSAKQRPADQKSNSSKERVNKVRPSNTPKASDATEARESSEEGQDAINKCTSQQLLQATSACDGLMAAPEVPGVKRATRRVSCPGPQKPDFNGVWMMTRFDGDFDSFMKESGVGWALRKTAAALAYGAKATWHTIVQKDNSFSIITKNPKGSFEKKFVVDGSEQEEVDPVEKKPMIIVPTWDNDVLHIEARLVTGGEMPTARRYMLANEMVVQMITPSGISVRRFFTKQ